MEIQDYSQRTDLPIHMLAWQESVEGSWADVAPSAESTSAAWLVMSRYSCVNWYRFMIREASTTPSSLLIWKDKEIFVGNLPFCPTL